MKEEQINKGPFWMRLISFLSEVGGVLSGFAILTAAVVIVYEIIVRFVLRMQAIWQLEFSIYLLMFATFVGAAFGLKNGAHVSIDIITIRLPIRVKIALEIIVSVLSLVFIIIVAWKGWQFWWEAYTMGWRSSSLWGPSMVIPYMLLPLGMSLTALQYLVLIGELISKLAVPQEMEKVISPGREG